MSKIAWGLIVVLSLGLVISVVVGRRGTDDARRLAADLQDNLSRASAESLDRARRIEELGEQVAALTSSLGESRAEAQRSREFVGELRDEAEYLGDIVRGTREGIGRGTTALIEALDIIDGVEGRD